MIAELLATAEKLRRQLPSTDGQLRRVASPVQCSALAALRGLDSDSSVFWRYRDRDEALVGFGIAAEPDLSLAATQRLLASCLGGAELPIHAHLGASFAAGDNQGIGALGRRRLIIPAWEVIQQADRCWLAVNQLNHTPPPLHPAGPKQGTVLTKGHSVPDQSRWCEVVSRALHEIALGTVEKVVLARKVVHDLSEDTSVSALFAHLAEKTPLSFQCLHRQGKDAWFTLTPERLFRQHGRNVLSEAVAGTTIRGISEEQDRALGEALMASDKERREHRNVVDHIVRTLNALGGHAETGPEPQLRRLPRIQHLCQTITAKLPEGSTPDLVLSTLHPTPAVCGQPPATSLSLLQRLEPFSRGWYAGPIGTITAKEVDLAVGIRSGMICNQQLTLFAGAGIVAGSEPLAEWHETEAKLSWIVELLSEPWQT